jgi:hypothetical protein
MLLVVFTPSAISFLFLIVHVQLHFSPRAQKTTRLTVSNFASIHAPSNCYGSPGWTESYRTLWEWQSALGFGCILDQSLVKVRGLLSLCCTGSCLSRYASVPAAAK